MLYASDTAISLASTLANPGVHVFSCNGMFDPDVTGTGHQPRGFDQLMLFYDHYIVTRAKIKVRFFNASTAVPAEVFVTVRDNSVASSSFLDYMESTLTKTAQLGTEGTSAATKVIEYDVNVGHFLGNRDPMTDPQLKGSTASNPTEGCSFHVGAFSPDLFTTSGVTILVTIEYSCSLVEPKIVASS
jgi:hypothetical protein